MNNRFGTENNGLFDMSPLPTNKEQTSEDSLSFAGTSKTVRAPASGGSAMSTDSVSRAPFGEIQNNNFEFKPVGDAPKPAKAPFATMMNQAESQADNAMTPTKAADEPMTPASVVSQSRITNTASAGAVPKPQIVWSELLLWTEPLQTLCVFVAGLVTFGLFTWIAYGTHKMSVVSAVAYLLLLDLGLNFFRYFVSKPWHDKCLWGGAAQMKHVLTRVNSVILHLASAHDKYLSAVDPMITLRVAGALWALAWIGSFMSLWWFALVSYIAVFTVPGIYQLTKDQLHTSARNIRAQTIDKVDAAGLPRTVRFVAVASAVAVMFYFASFTQALIGFFVAATYWRTLLVPREIDIIRTAAEPYTQSVHKVGRRVGVMAEDVFQRLSTAGPATRTKSHFRTE